MGGRGGIKIIFIISFYFYLNLVRTKVISHEKFISTLRVILELLQKVVAIHTKIWNRINVTSKSLKTNYNSHQMARVIRTFGALRLTISWTCTNNCTDDQLYTFLIDLNSFRKYLFHFIIWLWYWLKFINYYNSFKRQTKLHDSWTYLKCLCSAHFYGDLMKISCRQLSRNRSSIEPSETRYGQREKLKNALTSES